MLLVPPFLHPPTEPPNPPLPTPQMVPPHTALLPPPPHLQAITALRPRYALVQERRDEEKPERERCAASG